MNVRPTKVFKSGRCPGGVFSAEGGRNGICPICFRQASRFTHWATQLGWKRAGAGFAAWLPSSPGLFERGCRRSGLDLGQLPAEQPLQRDRQLRVRSGHKGIEMAWANLGCGQAFQRGRIGVVLPKKPPQLTRLGVSDDLTTWALGICWKCWACQLPIPSLLDGAFSLRPLQEGRGCVTREAGRRGRRRDFLPSPTGPEPMPTPPLGLSNILGVPSRPSKPGGTNMGNRGTEPSSWEDPGGKADKTNGRRNIPGTLGRFRLCLRL